MEEAASPWRWLLGDGGGAGSATSGRRLAASSRIGAQWLGSRRTEEGRKREGRKKKGERGWRRKKKEEDRWAWVRSWEERGGL
uniref:Uncharacterized protein n=1 Tax=Oryza nivara TaxID=4536 RepID=A0A0E0ICW5_ORYNI